MPAIDAIIGARESACGARILRSAPVDVGSGICVCCIEQEFRRSNVPAQRLRPATQLMQNKLADWRAEVRSSAELGGQACSLPPDFRGSAGEARQRFENEVSLRKNLEYATSHED